MPEKTRKNRQNGGNKKGDNKKNTDKSTDAVPAEPKLKEMKHIKVEEGRKTFLKCELAAGNPTPKVRWFKDGKELTNGDNKQDIKVRKKKKGKVSELHIKKATEVHAGPYICEASNNLGKARIFGNLTVIQAVK